MSLHVHPFTQIQNGEKVIESRLYDDKRKNIHVDDEIVFTLHEDKTQKIHVLVKELVVKKSFDELFNSAKLSLFGYKNKEESESIYRHYTKEDENKCGVIGILFSIIGQ